MCTYLALIKALILVFTSMCGFLWNNWESAGLLSYYLGKESFICLLADSGLDVVPY